MKCPKCGYLGYERVERCRNCGYEFSLTSVAPTPDLRLRDAGSRVPRPLDDLDLVDAATPPKSAIRFDDLGPEAGLVDSDSGGLGELPLFGAPITDDVPLITRASPPRPPLSVRRATPDVPRLRAETRAPLLEWPEPPPFQPSIVRPAPQREPAPALAAAPPLGRQVDGTSTEPAAIGARGLAVAIDVMLLGVVDLLVVYLTMKICRLTPSEVALVPKAPLISFLLLQNGGYIVAFTTTGQTLGKMIAGVRVLADDSDGPPDIGRSALRAVIWLLLALPAGLGLLSAMLGHDGRGWHDRFAGTRVVRAGA